MKRDLFRRYVWLVDTIRHGNKPTYDQIAKAWIASPLNDDGSPLALRTFHNHRDAIEHLFGIRILCDRSDHNRYYIADDGETNSTRLKVWMLQTLSLSNTIHRSSSVENRILLDITPEEKFGLLTVIDAMRREKTVKLTYSIPLADGRTEFEIAPYCVRFWKSCWYMFGKDEKSGDLRTFDFSSIVNITIGDKRFRYPYEFDAKEYFNNYFGMEVDDSLPVQTIRLKISGKSRDMIRTMPLHHSQKEVLATADYSVFLFNFVPTDDFISSVLSMGPDCEVIGPFSLRDRVKALIDNMAEAYSKPVLSAASKA